MAKEKKRPEQIRKPFEHGAATDRNTLRSALRVFGAIVTVMVFNMLLGAVMSVDITIVRVLLSLVVLTITAVLFARAGRQRGTEDTALGENYYLQRTHGHPADPAAVRTCWHPLKGFAQALLGSLPILAAAVLLALTAVRQTYGIGVLPSWVQTMQQNGELGGALDYYNGSASLGLQDVLRVIVRMALMPFVTLIGT